MQELEKFKIDLKLAFEQAGEVWRNAYETIWCFGPRRVGPNILFNHTANYKRSIGEENRCANVHGEFDSSFVNGFQMATLAGPLCEEPMMGVAFVVEEWDILDKSSA